MATQTIDYSFGDWPGRYGDKGVWVAGIPDAGYPAGMARAPITLSHGSTIIQQDPSTSPKSCVKPDGSARILAEYYNGSSTYFDCKVNVPPGPARLTFLIYDHYGTGQRQSLQLFALDGTTPLWPAPIEVNDFKTAPVYCTVDIDGPCIARWTKVAMMANCEAVFVSSPLGPPPDTTSPVVSASIDATGKVLTITASETIQGHGGFVLAGQADYPTSLEFASGDGITLSFNIVRLRPFYAGESALLSYSAGDVTDGAGNPLLPFMAQPVQNNSTAQGPVWQVIAREVLAQSDANGVRTCQTIEALLWPETP